MQNQPYPVDVLDAQSHAARGGGSGLDAPVLRRTPSPCAPSVDGAVNVATAAWLSVWEESLDGAADAEEVMALLTQSRDSGHLQDIEHLDLASLGLCAGHIERLGALFASHACGGPGGPITLTLNLNSVGLEGARSLASWPCFGRLCDLKLGSAELGDEGVQQLVLGSYPSLRSLSLWTNSLTPAGAHILASSELWQSLHDLSVADNDLGDEGAAALCQYPCLTLAKLDIQWNGLSRDGALALAAHFPSTEVLIYDNKIR